VLTSAVKASICAASDTRTLFALREQEQRRLEMELGSISAVTVNQSLRELHDALIGRVLQLAEMELASQGLAAPPAPYAYLLFGSGGRGEMTFASDQDSGIVYADADSTEEAEICAAYFAKLGGIAVRMQVEIGYPPCEGNVLASNPQWCSPLSQWERRFEAWFADPTWENVRYLLIVADCRAVAGSAVLCDQLRDHFFDKTRHTASIIRRMVENTLRHKVLVGIFGQLLRERYGELAGRVDIKYGAYIPLVNIFRLLSVQSGIRETGTLDRIGRLRQAGVLNDADGEAAVEAFTLILELRLGAELTPARIRKLKQALKWGKRMQRRIGQNGQNRFGGG
jgi:CBS domain-containing protein